MAGFWRRYLGFLAFAIAGESRAYGFTLVIWATGVGAVARFGLPGEGQLLLFVAGALAGFAIALTLAFPDTASTYHPTEQPRRYAFGELHVFSVLAGIGAGYLAMLLTSGSLAYFLAALAAVALFQLVLTLEIMMSTVRRWWRKSGSREAEQKAPGERLEQYDAELDALRRAAGDDGAEEEMARRPDSGRDGRGARAA